MTTVTDGDTATPSNFIRNIIDEDLKNGKHGSRVATRFPPEPNGYLHIGHAKSICLNFGIASDYQGATCNLRFDDTNPAKESIEYVDSIKEDIKWLGFDWDSREYFASDYFEKLYQFAEKLITDGKAFVCDLSFEEMREHRGTLKEPGKNSPYRDRSVDENMQLFRGMRAGKFEDGSRVLRAKIDMGSPNVTMRDPIIYRVKRANHHRTGDRWCIYPMYDFTHCLSDSLERITHSLCTLEFQDNRPLYDWVLENVDTPDRPQQIEFARLNLTYCVMSKRKLLQLVEDNKVNGWNDPRMPTISGFRRRGYTPEAIRNFCERIGVAKRDSMVDMGLLEFCIREDLNAKSPRVMGVLRPLKVVIDNYPEGEMEELDAPFHPDEPSWGSRRVPFSKTLYIEQDDFMENPPRKFFRLAPGKEIRLRYAYYITCTSVVKDDEGNVVEVHCTYDPETKGGQSADGRRVKGTSHWVSAEHAIATEVRLYDYLFDRENPDGEDDFTTCLNPKSLEVVQGMLEPSLAKAKAGYRCQFERLGYFFVDPIDSSNDKPIFNRTVTLRDSWAKIKKKGR